MPVARYPLALLSLLALLPAIHAQMQPQGQLDGEMVPVVRVGDTYLDVVKDGRTRVVGRRDYQIRRGPGFADGLVQIGNVESDLNVIASAKPSKRSDPYAVRFRYSATLVADRSLPSCYAVLTFVTQGSLGTWLTPIGRLGAGSSHKLTIELSAQVDKVGSLHIISNGVEVRTNQHPGDYDVFAYCASLVGGSSELGAAELLKSAQFFPHVLSDDGRLVATFREEDAKTMLAVVDLASVKILKKVRIADSGAHTASPTWVSDHEIAYIAEDDTEHHRDDWRLNVLDIQTGTIRTLLHDMLAIVESVRDHPEILVVEDYKHGSSFFKYNVHTGKTFAFEDPEAGYYTFDVDGVARVERRTDGNRVTYYCRPTAASGWRAMDGLVKQPGLKFSYRGQDLIDRTADIIGMGPDPDTLYLGSRVGSDRFQLVSYSLSSGLVTHTLAHLPKWDLTNSDGLMVRLLFQRHGRRLLGVVYEDQRPHVIWTDPHFAAIQRSIDARFPDHFNLPIDFTDDGATLLYFSSSVQDPGTYYAFHPGQGELVPLLIVNQHLNGKNLSRTVPLEFPARDGQMIPAYLTPPREGAPKPAPLIVYIHGGPAARDRLEFDATNQFFASRGYAVLQVNYRGSSGFGAAFQKAGLFARMDSVILDDIADGARFLIKRGDANPNRVVAMGGSFGGWATYMSLVKYPDLYKAGIAIAAVSNWRDTISDDRWFFDNQIGSNYFKFLLNMPANAAVEPQLEPSLRASEIHQPVLIIHGERDTTVRSTQAGAMLRALRKNNPHVESKSFTYATHTYWPFSDEVETLNLSAHFLTENLPLSAETAQPLQHAVAAENPVEREK